MLYFHICTAIFSQTFSWFGTEHKQKPYYFLKPNITRDNFLKYLILWIGNIKRNFLCLASQPIKLQYQIKCPSADAPMIRLAVCQCNTLSFATVTVSLIAHDTDYYTIWWGVRGKIGIIVFHQNNSAEETVEIYYF